MMTAKKDRSTGWTETFGELGLFLVGVFVGVALAFLIVILIRPPF